MRNIITSIIIASSLIIGAFNIPSHYLNLDNLFGSDQLGLALTDITTSTKVSAYPAIQTANNSLLETDINALEATTTMSLLTSLPNQTITGTIATGVWEGTGIDVARQGTGTTSPTADQVILGNGASGFKVVAGFGTSGQFLTSGGAGTPPTWATGSVDETADFNWTGTNFLVKNLFASSTAANPLTLNGVAYDFPSSDGAAGQTLQTDATGTLTWENTNGTLEVDGLTRTTSNTSSTTAKTIKIPANTLGANDMLRIKMVVTGSGGSNQKEFNIDFGTGAATTSIISSSLNLTATSQIVDFDIEINNKNDTSSQELIATAGNRIGSNTFSTASTITTATRDTTAATYLTFIYRVVNGADSVTIKNIQVELLRN